ncbi:MAG: hypothetical protein AABX11_03960 [Nanoarchaeota archaeon]|mgnify:CR=1 FL=1
MTLKSKLAKGVTYLALAIQLAAQNFIINTSFQSPENGSKEKTIEELTESFQNNNGYSKVPGFKAKAGFDLYLKTPDKNVENLVDSYAQTLPITLRTSAKSVSIDTQDERDGGIEGGGMIEIYSTNSLFRALPHELGHAWIDSKPDSERKRILKEWNAIARIEYNDRNTSNGSTWRNIDTKKIKGLYEQITQEKEKIQSEENNLTRLNEQIYSKYSDVIKTGIIPDAETGRTYSLAAEEFEKKRSTLSEFITEHNARINQYTSLRNSANSPKEGLISPYAGTSQFEDIGETMRYIFQKPQEAKALTQNPDSRYAQKMQFLAKEVGFNLEACLERK